ncbi:hypothetical protein B0H13DRAFT_2273991 [Mycena leptocephala]|nr:hypothetical protein B0H13DRAFT_2273991 [Mycena leptocephala]
MSSLPPRTSLLSGPPSTTVHRTTCRTHHRRSRAPAIDVGLAAIAAAVPALDFALERSKTASRPSRLQGLLVPKSTPLGPRRRVPSSWRSTTSTSPRSRLSCPTTLYSSLPASGGPSSAPSMDAYTRRSGTPSRPRVPFIPQGPAEQEQREQREREKKSGKAAKAPPSSTIVVFLPAVRQAQYSKLHGDCPAPAKSARKRTASVVSEDSEANSPKKVKIDVDEDEDKPVASTSSSAAKGKDNKTDLVPTELNQINLFTETDSEYFVVLVKKRPSHVYKFSSHQPETSTNRTSSPTSRRFRPLETRGAHPRGDGDPSHRQLSAVAVRFCDHHLTLQEILDFHARVASDVIEADDKLPIFIAGLNDATLRLAAAAQLTPTLSSPLNITSRTRRLDSPLHPLSQYRRVSIAFTSSDDTPTVVQHINSSSRRTTGPTTIDAEADAETDQESVSLRKAAAETPIPKTPPKKPVSSKTDSGKGKDKAT